MILQDRARLSGEFGRREHCRFCRGGEGKRARRVAPPQLSLGGGFSAGALASRSSEAFASRVKRASEAPTASSASRRLVSGVAKYSRASTARAERIWSRVRAWF